MRKFCERPGCTGLAESSYGIDQQHLLVWIDNRALGDRELAGQLCRRHADALVVPRGWTIDDRRDPTPTLFRVADDVGGESPHSSTHSRHRRPVQVDDVPTLFDGGPGADIDVGSADATTSEVIDSDDRVDDEMVDDEVVDNEAVHHVTDDEVVVEDVQEFVYEPDPAETQAMPWSPRLQGTGGFDDEDEGGPVFGRLLGRAFNRQRDEGDD